MSATPNPDVRHRHMPELQSLRGIAAALVMFGHAGAFYAEPIWFHQILMSVWNGTGAVVVFFVLSGYVLSNQLSREGVSPRSTALFYVRRLFRIYPALWAASLLALGYVVFLHWRVPVADTSAWFQDRFKIQRYTLIGIVASFAGVLAFLLPPLWSIFAELVGSLLMPLMALSAVRRLAFLGVGLVLGAISLTLGPHTYYGVGLYMFDFWLGAAGFYVVAAGWRALSPHAAIRPVVLVLALAAIMAGPFFASSQYDPLVTLAYALAALSVIVAIAGGWAGLGFLRSRALVSLGDWSYSLYLLHFPVMCLLAVGLQLAGASQLGSVVRALLLVGLTTAVTIPLSAASYRFVELPGIALGSNVVRRLRAWASRGSTEVETPVSRPA